MSVTIKPAFLAIVFLASPLPLATGIANAAETCLTAPKGPGPQGSRWYYRLEHPSMRKCWHLVLKGGKPQAVARVTQPATDDDAEPVAATAPAPAKPAERSAEPRKPALEPVVRTLVTRNASNPGALVPPPDQSFQTASADDSATAPAPAGQVTATEPTPAVAAVPQPVAAAPAQSVSDTGSTSLLSWLLAAVALLGSVACATFILIEVRRRRTDVLNTVQDDDALPGEASAGEHDDLRIDPATFAPLPALRATRHEDDVDLALRRYARRRAA